MSDIPPFALVIAYEDLIVQTVGLGIDGQHVIRETKQLRNILRSREILIRQAGDREVRNLQARQHKSPLAERWHVYVIRQRFQPGLLQRFDNAPIGLPREKRRSTLDHYEPIRADMSRQQTIKSRRIQLAQRVIGRIRKIDDNEIEYVLIPIQPWKSVVVDDVNLGDFSEPLLRSTSTGFVREELRHLGIQVHQRDLLQRRILQDFPHSQAIATAKHQHAASPRQRMPVPDAPAPRDTDIRRAS